ncbi:hypothetical protein KM043_008770 [Ampulex compressa]|nr:hypothetical protein KM043_008770 [Ampulex compressa]
MMSRQDSRFPFDGSRALILEALIGKPMLLGVFGCLGNEPLRSKLRTADPAPSFDSPDAKGKVNYDNGLHPFDETSIGSEAGPVYHRGKD